eukprot:TRINITY_DN70162_c0_g1_i1.p1 TRINITY_DN70162_c0_g1~~TRINITY_DN70162_c0_g1_i1.p1  ORF type:complete len:555 (+),score=199.16 TRINITY_DN70162_c0_g1_i1:88-1665(+)
MSWGGGKGYYPYQGKGWGKPGPGAWGKGGYGAPPPQGFPQPGAPPGGAPPPVGKGGAAPGGPQVAPAPRGPVLNVRAAGPYSLEQWALRDILLRMKHRKYISLDVTSAQRETGPTAPQLPTTRTRVSFDVSGSATSETDAVSPAGGAQLTVRVLMLRVDGAPGDNLGQRLKLLLQRRKDGTVRLYGGHWAPSDGKATSPASAQETARRILTASGIDITGVELLPFVTQTYLREGQRERTMVFVAQFPDGAVVAPPKVVAPPPAKDKDAMQEDAPAPTQSVVLAEPVEMALEQLRRAELLAEEGFEVALTVDVLWEAYEELCSKLILHGLILNKHLRDEATARQEARAKAEEAFKQKKQEALESAQSQWAVEHAGDNEAMVRKRVSFDDDWAAKAKDMQESLPKDPEITRKLDQTLLNAFAFLDRPELAQSRWVTEERLRTVMQAAGIGETPQMLEDLLHPMLQPQYRAQGGLINYQDVVYVQDGKLLPQEPEQDETPAAKAPAAATSEPAPSNNQPAPAQPEGSA